LWEAANILRGPVDPANLRDFVFPLLFFKRLSDTWDEEQEKAFAEFGEDIDEDTAADFHRFVIPRGCNWADLRRVAENHGLALLEMMQHIEEANPERLAQIFGNAPWADHRKMPPSQLERLIAHLGRMRLRLSDVTDDVLGHAYEFLLKEFSDESATSAGQFFTPRAVVHLLVGLLQPQPGETIYDPACGSGGMLIEAASCVRASGGDITSMRFFGQEINQAAASIGRMNVLIHELEDAQIRTSDTLRTPQYTDRQGALQQFDVVVANPPFSHEHWGADTWARDPHRRAFGGTPPAECGDYAWIQHMIASMTPQRGRVGVVMPLPALFRSGNEYRVERSIREALLSADLLEAVVGLGPNLFYATPIPTCLMIFRKTKHVRSQGHVLMIDASRCFTPGRNQNYLTSVNISQITNAYRGETLGVDVSRRLVPIDEIRSRGYDLNMGLYLSRPRSRRVRTTDALAHLREQHGALSEVETGLFVSIETLIDDEHA
jgi:type I restriction enzyme M protein